MQNGQKMKYKKELNGLRRLFSTMYYQFQIEWEKQIISIPMETD